MDTAPLVMDEIDAGAVPQAAECLPGRQKVRAGFERPRTNNDTSMSFSQG